MLRNVLVITIAALLLLSETCFAELDKEEMVKIELLSKKLGLTDDQKARLTVERDKSKQQLMELERKWQTLHNRLRQEVRKDKPEKSKIDKISRDIGKVQGDIVSLRTGSLVYLKSILTPEQIMLIEEGRPAE